MKVGQEVAQINETADAKRSIPQPAHTFRSSSAYRGSATGFELPP